ncbi:Pls/PosA family non-ribosomal peptide synthetase [Methylobacterium organophilum]|uniref:D-alanine--D-alanyl carrier protein ligase n=1 Tax=Methylobacterium organophilum TaxID=410 RepID=A0ABQ4TA23_METOR|nr:Pls/PosA family non-ribosomal peptide synthetase [Methylobacterium organophilum]GJE27911.1 D-alanine--D-alanyl carrier protein ligase [Methylobacterium organophilum]
MNMRPDLACRSILRGRKDPSLLRDELLPEIVSDSARARPEHIAIVFGGTRITYAELEARADRVARALRARGAGPGRFVGLWMTRSLDLHVALLGILKSGAAYIPFDADAPPDRIGECLTDCAADLLIVDSVTAAKLERAPAATPLPFAALIDEGGAGAPIDLRALGLTNAHPAYAIYTSGSTGKPKGIVISHANICHYLRAANQVYGMTGDDVCFQGASVAFDLSLEEIFVPYLVGATLWVASPAILGEVDALPGVMRAAGITVLDTVPTLLAMMPEDVPSLRIIILGGEACPPAVRQRWCRPGRTVFNSYGPTEATVVATVDIVTPDAPVTIGGPIPNYTCYIVTEQGILAGPGEEGELLIGGPGLAGGYLGRPDLTAEKFIANPFDPEGADPVLYRSGDAVSVDPGGKILFHGRIDDQVKLRGFRIELGEIEARLSTTPGIAQAAVVVRPDNGIDRLVAFVVPEAGRSLDRAALRAALKAQLPPYMVPAHFEEMAVLPRLTSGKADRKALKAMVLQAADEAEVQEAPQTATEAALLAAAQPLFPGQVLAFEADFFNDLGGHSLLAARFLAAVRETSRLASLTLEDVYGQRSLRAMAAALDTRISDAPDAGPVDLSFEPPPRMRRLLCGLAQAACLPLLLLGRTGPWLTIFVVYELITTDEVIRFHEVLMLLGTYALVTFAVTVAGILGKRAVLWRAKPGRYPLWGVYFFRWWLAKQFVGLTHLSLMQGTPLAAATMRALGARVGRRSIVSGLNAGAIDLLTIGDDVTLGAKLSVANAEVVGNELVIGPVEIQSAAYIGTSCAIGHGVIIEEGAELGDLTAILPGTRVGAFEHWDGSPGRRVGAVDPATWPAPAPEPTRAMQAARTAFFALMVLFMPAMALLPVFPAFYLFDRYDTVLQALVGLDYHWYLPVLTWPTAMLLVFGTAMLVTAIRWIVLPRAGEGTHSIHSGFYLRKWTVGLASDVMLDTLSSLFSTVYMRHWYRLMGARIGRDTEVATNFAGRYDTIEIGDHCFVADEVVVGDEDIRRGWMTIRKVRTGSRVFIGNDAVLPPGTDIPDGCLIGIKSKPPAGSAIEPGDTWFGSPPLRLPVRQRFDDAQTAMTFRPSAGRRLLRAVFELFSASMPTMMFITLGTYAAEYVLFPALEHQSWGMFLAIFVATCTACALILAGVVLVLKWIMMGVYRPGNHGLWSWWALRTEAMTTLYWGTAGAILLDSLRGTVLLPPALRLFGVKIGHGVFLDSTDITEFDCVRIGDHAAINATANLQTHLFEDRVMKIGPIEIGRGVSVGALTTVLYDTRVGGHARLGPLTIIMKGEAIPANTQWAGAPARPMQAAA